MDSSPPYVTRAPSPQQTLDLFKGSWASRLPGEWGALQAGQAGLFEDPRVDWVANKLAEWGQPIAGSHVVELGPLEGGHTYQLSRRGAASVTAIEAHREAYLKCLILKELLGVERVNFLLGDATEFLRHAPRYDLGFACGILYHLVNPMEFLEQLCRSCRTVFLWTVYWDPEFARAHPDVPAGSGPAERRTQAGVEHTVHRHSYGGGFSYSQFWGGAEPHANWMERDDILRALAHFGLTRQIVELEANPNGAALRVMATRD